MGTKFAIKQLYLNKLSTMNYNRIKFLSLALSLGLQFNAAWAQTIKDVQKLIDNEQFETALSQLDALISKGDAEGYYYKGYVLQELDEPQEAFKLYETGVAKNANAALNYVGLGRKYLAFGDITTAKENFEKAMTLAPKDVNVLNGVAEAYIKSPQKDFSKALVVIEKAEKLDPKNETTKLLFGDIIYERDKKTGNLTNAISKYNEVESINPNNSRALMRKGKIYEKGRNYNAAIENYEEAVKKNPNFAPAYREQGEIYAKAQMYAKAKQSYEKYLELCGANKYAQMRYLNFLWETKDYDKTISEAEKLTQTPNYNNSINRVMAYAYFEKQNYPKAEEIMNLFLSKQPIDKITYLDQIYYGKILSKNTKKEDAVKAFNKALEIDSINGSDAYGELAILNFELKKYPEAIYYYTKKDGVGKATANDYFRMGVAHYIGGNHDAASGAFDKLIAKAPSYPSGYLWKAKSIDAKDQKKEGFAKDAYELFLTKITPENKDANKDDVIDAYKYLTIYYHNTAKNPEQTQLMLEQLKTIDATLPFIKDAEAKIAKKQALK